MTKKEKSSLPLKNILQVVNEIEEKINKKKLFLSFNENKPSLQNSVLSEKLSCNSSNSVVFPISGGQDSIFLLFCFSFLQSQLAFKVNLIWCNHFWQGTSFYTTLHITRCALCFSSPIFGFLSFGANTSPLFYETVKRSYKKKKKNIFEPKTKTMSATVKSNLYNSSQTLLLYKAFFSCIEQSFLKRESKALSFARICKMKPCSSTTQSFAFSVVFLESLFGFQFFSSRTKNCNYKTPCVTYKSTCKSCTSANLLAKLCTLLLRKSDALASRFVSKALLCTCFTNRRFVRKAKQKCAKQRCTEQRKPKNKRANSRQRIYATKSCVTGICRAKVKGYKKFVEKISEGRARNWRHITTARGTTFYESKPCVYGHTGSDRVETTLFNLIRGSGKRGTTCLPWKQRYSDFCYNKFYPCCTQIVKNTHLRQCHNFTSNNAL